MSSDAFVLCRNVCSGDCYESNFSFCETGLSKWCPYLTNEICYPASMWGCGFIYKTDKGTKTKHCIEYVSCGLTASPSCEALTCLRFELWCLESAGNSLLRHVVKLLSAAKAKAGTVDFLLTVGIPDFLRSGVTEFVYLHVNSSHYLDKPSLPNGHPSVWLFMFPL